MKKNKKILIISTQLSGGCFQYADSIIKKWSTEKELVLSAKGRENDETNADWTIKFYGYNHVIRLISFFISLIRITYGIVRRRYSAVLLFGVTKWDYFYLKLCSFLGLKSFTVIHDGKMHEGEYNKKFQENLIEIMHVSTHLIFLSEYVKKLVKENFNIAKPSHIAPHGLISYGELKERPQREKPSLLFLGRVTKYKGIDTLLDAINDVPDSCYSKLVIAGQWDSTIPVPEVSQKVKIVNKFLSTDEILHFIDDSDIMIFPYREATQSGVATLALNYNKPSIVTKTGAFKEQFSSRSALFIEPCNPLELAQAIKKLSFNIDIRNSMVNEIKKEKYIFDWSNITRDLEEYINESLN